MCFRSHSIHNVRSHDTPDPLYVHRTSFGNYSFVAVDAVPRPGPKRPFNFFGILDEVGATYLWSFASGPVALILFFLCFWASGVDIGILCLHSAVV